LVEAIRAHASRPHIYGAQHDLEYEVAERIQRHVPCAERVAFSSSGSEVVQLALRLARAHTNRTRVLRFEGHYHGWLDSVLLSYRGDETTLGPRDHPLVALNSKGQPPNAAENVISLPWNDLPALEALFAARGAEIAAAITEPVLCNSGCLMPAPGFLEALRRLTAAHGALLIFDEIITGFRMALGGAQRHFGITPDLATFGKAVAGGLPLSVVAGRAGIMEQIVSGGVAFGGTFNGNPLSLAAAKATLDVLAENGGEALMRANERGSRLKEGLAAIAREAGIPLAVTGFGTAFALHFTQAQLGDYRTTLLDDKAALDRFLLAALHQGIYLLPDGRWYTSAAHTEEDIDQTLAAFRHALA
jgi:glutamate-1-semialdehyde 2,1-aminomutase